MKKNVIKLSIRFFIPVFIIMLCLVPGCKKKTGPVVKDLALLKLIPVEATEIFCVDVKRLTVLDYYQEMIAGVKKKMAASPGEGIVENYEEFIDKIGIDIEKNIRELSIAFFPGGTKNAREEAVANALLLIDLDYDRDKILTFLKNKKSEKKIDYDEEEYDGVTIVRLKSGSLPLFAGRRIENPAFSFIDKRTIAAGKTGRLKQVIDLSKNKGKSILLRAEMESYLNMSKTAFMASFAIVVPGNLCSKKKIEEGLYSYDLTRAQIVSGNIDQINGVWHGELKLVMKNEQANAQLASVLAFYKTVAGVSVGAEFSEVLDNTHIDSSPEWIEPTFSIPHELIQKLFKRIETARFSLSKLTGGK